MKIQIKNRFNGSILFEHECKYNNIKLTLIEGIKANADLSNADLSNEDLRNCDLRNCDLSYCDLSGSNFSGSILRNADLRNCNFRNCILRNCDLSGSNFSGSNLTNADLRNCILRNCDLRNCDLSGSNFSGSNLINADLRNCILPIFSKWSFSIIKNEIIKIGCKEKTIFGWDLWFASKEEFDTKRGTAEFKQIEAMYLAYKAYVTHLNS